MQAGLQVYLCIFIREWELNPCITDMDNFSACPRDKTATKQPKQIHSRSWTYLDSAILLRHAAS